MSIEQRDDISVLSPPGWAARYIGIPYADRGHDFGGCNCWGLVHLVLKERTGIAVGAYSEISAADLELATAKIVGEAAREPWRGVGGEPAALDVALMRGQPFHCGIVVAPGWLLHVWRSPRSIAMRLSDPRIRARLVGFYRHRDLEGD